MAFEDKGAHGIWSRAQGPSKPEEVTVLCSCRLSPSACLSPARRSGRAARTQVAGEQSLAGCAVCPKPSHCNPRERAVSFCAVPRSEARRPFQNIGQASPQPHFQERQRIPVRLSDACLILAPGRGTGETFLVHRMALYLSRMKFI